MSHDNDVNFNSEPQDKFIVYYLNYPKTVELCMTLQNVEHIRSDVERAAESKRSSKHSSRGTLGANLPFHVSGELSSSSEAAFVNSESCRIAETYEVKNTKSTYLKRLFLLAKSCKLEEKSLSDANEGELLRIDDVPLFVMNEDEMLQMQVLRHDALKGFRVQGVDINNLISSMLEDYSYVLASEVRPSDEDNNVNSLIAVKIPTESENEFESSYRIRDLLLGKVTIVGVYKGKVSAQKLLMNTFSDLQGIAKPVGSESRVFKSADSGSNELAGNQAVVPDNSFKSYESCEVHYLDLISIVQPVSFPSRKEADADADGRQSLIKRFIAWVKGLFS